MPSHGEGRNARDLTLTSGPQTQEKKEGLLSDYARQVSRPSQIEKCVIQSLDHFPGHERPISVIAWKTFKRGEAAKKETFFNSRHVRMLKIRLS